MDAKKNVCGNCHMAIPRACKDCPNNACVEKRRKAINCSVGKQLAFDFFKGGGLDLAARA